MISQENFMTYRLRNGIKIKACDTNFTIKDAQNTNDIITSPK